jgi:hypothetical protein
VGQSTNIQLQGVPQKIYVWAGHADSAREGAGAYELTDSMCGLESLNVFYNTNIFLSGSSQQDLYNIAIKNGCRLSFSQWTKTMGSVLALNFGDDIGLPADQAPGLQGQNQLYITGTWRNPATGVTIVNPQIYVLVIYGGSIEDHDGNFILQQNTVTPLELAAAPLRPAVYKSDQPLVGGGIMDILKSAISPLLNVAQMGASALFPEFSPFIGMARSGIKKLTGHGYAGQGMKSKKKGKSAKRQRMSGGKCHPSKAQLMLMD